MWSNSKDIRVRLLDFAAQENHDGEPWDTMQTAAEYIASLQERIKELEENGAQLASWQCPYGDGITGLTSDDYGHQYCNKDKQLTELQERCERLEEAVPLIAKDFFYWWYNAKGSNTEQGFEEYTDILKSLTETKGGEV